MNTLREKQWGVGLNYHRGVYVAHLLASYDEGTPALWMHAMSDSFTGVVGGAMAQMRVQFRGSLDNCQRVVYSINAGTSLLSMSTTLPYELLKGGVYFLAGGAYPAFALPMLQRELRGKVLTDPKNSNLEGFFASGGVWAKSGLLFGTVPLPPLSVLGALEPLVEQRNPFGETIVYPNYIRYQSAALFEKVMREIEGANLD